MRTSWRDGSGSSISAPSLQTSEQWCRDAPSGGRERAAGLVPIEIIQSLYSGGVHKSPATLRNGHDEPLGFVIASVGHAAATAFERALAETGLHPRHFAVLRGLKDGEAQSQQQLAQALGIPASRVVGLLDELVRRGLVSRRESPTDRRVKLVALLEAGREELQRLIALAGQSERTVTAGLSADEQAELRRLLGIVYDNVAA
jgi:MarR family transcriptional regulator for hemolysin